ncbi:nuclear transport factor 2 family protein [Pelomonas sp. PFR6]|uniref:Nuclear transport factor 2 family protein n=2 Tax=Roseateles violae TaxID=3058042 RepID=A0ABT8DST1_9BURK|nr:nuclear transport factor 2 family protein [Pelomonas sp. PFR6]MDN3920085.1 nuclear transport factor 2 family protein [Pelomonas sp. PFR6]
MPTLSADLRTTRLIEAYVGLRPEGLPALLELYDPAASFKDPFNEVRGRAAIERIFRQMFEDLREPRFIVLTAASEGDDAFLTWELHFRRQGRGEPMTIRGASHLRYAATGLLALHRDYWDAAEELYAKLPLLGALMRALRRRLSTPQQQ